jgi:hypothetical protein
MKVTKIVNDCVKSGANWSQSSVELNDGQIVRVFNPVMVGDTVYSEQKGGYTNWKVKKSSNDYDKVINQLWTEIQTLQGRVEVLERSGNVALADNFGVSSQVDDFMDSAPDFLKISKFESERTK